MTSSSPQIAEFFGVILAYTEIIEKFGKFPLHWDQKNLVFRLDWRFRPYFKFWVKIVTSFVVLVIPAYSIVLRFLVNKLYFMGTLEDGVPLPVVTLSILTTALVAYSVVTSIPIIVLDEGFITGEINHAFKMFGNLRECKSIIL